MDRLNETNKYFKSESEGENKNKIETAEFIVPCT